MTKFIKGNCVSSPRPPCWSTNHKEFFDSIHILSQKDIDRGYYWCNNGTSSYDLTKCVHSTPAPQYSNCCQTMSGKVTQPITFIKFMKSIRHLSNTNHVFCYIKFKGVKTKVKGFISDDSKMVYFGTNSGYYKTKVYVDELGTLRGVTEDSHLSAKQRRTVTNLGEQ